MVEQTPNVAGVALPAVVDVTHALPIRVKLGYIWKIITNRVHIVGPVDVSHVKSDHYMEGRLRVTLTSREAAEYKVFYAD